MQTQKNPVGSDLKAEVVQQNLQDLYESAHSHQVRTTAPAEREGSINDIIPVLLNGMPYLYIKFPVGWKRVLLS